MSGHHDYANDTLVRGAMLTEAVAQVLKRVHLDRDHDIPYLAGYSVDRSKIYIDRHLEKQFTDHLGRRHDVDPFLILHEATEKAMIDTWGLHYQHAHQIALRAEEAAVRAAGIEWRDYDRFMQQWIKRRRLRQDHQGSRPPGPHALPRRERRRTDQSDAKGNGAVGGLMRPQAVVPWGESKRRKPLSLTGFCSVC